MLVMGKRIITEEMRAVFKYLKNYSGEKNQTILCHPKWQN